MSCCVFIGLGLMVGWLVGPWPSGVSHRPAHLLYLVGPLNLILSYRHIVVIIVLKRTFDLTIIVAEGNMSSPSLSSYWARTAKEFIAINLRKCLIKLLCPEEDTRTMTPL